MRKNLLFSTAVAMIALAATAYGQFSITGNQARVGDMFSVTASGGFPNSVYTLVIDTDPGPTSFPDAGITLDIGFSGAFFAFPSSFLDPSGNGSYNVVVNTAASAGIAYHAQAVNVDPNNVFNISVSNSMEAIIHPKEVSAGTPSSISLGDDASMTVPLGFSFDFYGTNYTEVHVSSNGMLTFGSASTASFVDESFFIGGVPSIAPFFADLDPSAGGTITYDASATPGEGMTVYYNAVPLAAGSGTVTAQVSLGVGGHFQILYGSVTASDHPIVGATPGGQLTTNNVDLSAPGFEHYSDPLSTYQVFSGASTFDLSNQFVTYVRIPGLGYRVFH